MRLSQLWHDFSRKPHAVGLIFLLFIITHISLLKVEGFLTDDYLQRAYALGSESLQDKGLLLGNEQKEFIHWQFSFFDKAAGQAQTFKDYGVLPWWSDDNISLHLWRPLSSLTHWLDYQLWPESAFMMHLMGFVLTLIVFWAFYYFLSALKLPRSVITLVLCLFLLDATFYPVSSWIAARNSLITAVFLCMALGSFQLWLSSGLNKFYAISLFCTVLGLLSAEAGVVILAYIGSFLLLSDKHNLQRKVLWFLPFLLVLVVWRWYYQLQGYGAQGISQYIDPVHSPLAFSLHAVGQLPLLMVGLFTGLDSLDLFFPAIQPGLILVGWLLLVFVVYTLIQPGPYRKLKLALLLGSFLTLIPGTTIYTADPRVLIYAQFGFSVVLVLSLYEIYTQSVRYDGLVKNGLLVLFSIQFISQFLLMLLLTAHVWTTEKVTKQAGFDLMYGFASMVNEDRSLILLNHPDVFRLMYFPFIQADKKASLPEAMRVMNYAESSHHITRVAEGEYRIEPEGGFYFHPEDTDVMMPRLKFGGFFHDGVYDFKEGQLLDLPDMQIRIEQVSEQNRPMSISVILKKAETQYDWVYWSWKHESYQRLPGLEISEHFQIAGPN